MKKYEEIEKTIITTYRKEIWRLFMKAIRDYEMIKEGDKVAVCISGGKDSFLLAKCLEELKKHGPYPFELYYIVMDPGYTKEGLKKIKENAKILNLKLHIFKSTIFENIKDEPSPCYVCARKRRGHLYHYAEELGCNKIALGHHFDDVIETTLLSIIYGGETKTMLPKLKSDHFNDMELIRPLYLVHERDIIRWANYHSLEFINCSCPITKKNDSKRLEIKNLIKELKEKNKFVENNIFKSMKNINLNMVLGYNKDGIEYHYLDEYDKTRKE